MNEEERIKQLKELLRLKEELLEKSDDSVDKNRSNQSSKVKTLVNPTTGNLRFTEEPDLDNKKAAYSSAMMLSFIVLLFESLFLFLSYVIFR